jgi:hypothetical protein
MAANHPRAFVSPAEGRSRNRARKVGAHNVQPAMTRPLLFLAAIPLPPEGPARARLDALQKAVAAGIAPTPGQIARCWADAADGDVGQARDYLAGRRPWPTVGRKRGKLIRAVEAWEAAQP